MERDLLQRRLEEFRQLLREDPGEAYRHYGVTLLHSLEEEIYFEEMARFGWEPQTALDFYNQGVVATERGHHEEALSLYEEAVARDQELDCAYYNLACTHEALGNKEKQQEALEQYLALVGQRDRRDLTEDEQAEVEEAKQALAALKD